MRTRYLSVPINDIGIREYDMGFENSNNIEIAELPEIEFEILSKQKIFLAMNELWGLLIGDYESEIVEGKNLIQCKKIVEPMANQVPVLYGMLEKSILYDTLLGIDF